MAGNFPDNWEMTKLEDCMEAIIDCCTEQHHHRLDGSGERPRTDAVIIKRILRKYGYPPDKQARATELVLEQAEVICKDWAEGT